MSKARKYVKNKETGVVEKVSAKTFSALLSKGTHKASSGVEKVRVDSAYRRGKHNEKMAQRAAEEATA